MIRQTENQIKMFIPKLFYCVSKQFLYIGTVKKYNSEVIMVSEEKPIDFFKLKFKSEKKYRYFELLETTDIETLNKLLDEELEKIEDERRKHSREIRKLRTIKQELYIEKKKNENPGKDFNKEIKSTENKIERAKARESAVLGKWCSIYHIKELISGYLYCCGEYYMRQGDLSGLSEYYRHGFIFTNAEATDELTENRMKYIPMLGLWKEEDYITEHFLLIPIEQDWDNQKLMTGLNIAAKYSPCTVLYGINSKFYRYDPENPESENCVGECEEFTDENIMAEYSKVRFKGKKEFATVPKKGYFSFGDKALYGVWCFQRHWWALEDPNKYRISLRNGKVIGNASVTAGGKTIILKNEKQEN